MKKILLITLLFASTASVQAQPLRKKSPLGAFLKIIVGSITEVTLARLVLTDQCNFFYRNGTAKIYQLCKLTGYLSIHFKAVLLALQGFNELEEIAQYE